jgi:hypothetical protein
LQFFAPASDIDTYDGPVMRTGWFGSYDRMYLRVSRPDNVSSYTDMDRTWGNRWELGYMIDDVDHDHGWLLSYMRISGPNVWETNIQEAINRINEDDEGRPPADEDDPDLVEPPQDRNTVGPPNRGRYVNASDSLNLGNFNSLELNKIFRMDPLHHGGLLEPFFGVRYVRFESTDVDTTYVRYDAEGIVFPFPPVPPDTDLWDIGDAQTEDLISDQYLFTNDMIGGQLGMRWLKRISRWNLSSELRVFGFHNFQKLKRSYEIQRTYYDGGGTGSEIDGIVYTRQWEDWHTTSTVVGTDIRAEAAFELTRDVMLTGGMQFLGFFDGIGRGDDIGYNSQDLIMVGLTFGVVINR